MSTYEGIEIKKLEWLDDASGITGQAATISAASIGNSFLPLSIWSRMIVGKTYIVTLKDDDSIEILAATRTASSVQIKRGLEGTAAKAWPKGSEVFQSFTSSQLRFLMKKAGNVPPAPSDYFGDYLGTVTQAAIEGGDNEYWVFSAPQADTGTHKYNTLNQETPSAYDESNGTINTYWIDTPTHPAAEYCVDYRGGGFDDWYMPANDELLLLYAANPSLEDKHSTGGTLLSSTSVAEGGGNPSWKSQCHMMRWSSGSIGVTGKTLPSKVVPFRRMIKP